MGHLLRIILLTENIGGASYENMHPVIYSLSYFTRLL